MLAKRTLKKSEDDLANQKTHAAVAEQEMLKKTRTAIADFIDNLTTGLEAVQSHVSRKTDLLRQGLTATHQVELQAEINKLLERQSITQRYVTQLKNALEMEVSSAKLASILKDVTAEVSPLTLGSLGKILHEIYPKIDFLNVPFPP